MFDDIINLEDRFIEEGKQLGASLQEITSMRTGREIGLSRGLEIGQELGFYKSMTLTLIKENLSSCIRY